MQGKPNYYPDKYLRINTEWSPNSKVLMNISGPAVHADQRNEPHRRQIFVLKTPFSKINFTNQRLFQEVFSLLIPGALNTYFS